MKKRQRENDFDSEFASAVAQTRRQRQLLRTGQIVDPIANIHSLPIYNPPRELLAMEDTLLAVGVVPIDVVLVLDHSTLGVITSPPSGFLASLLLARILAKAVVFGEFRFLGRLRLGLVRQQFLEFANLSFKPRNRLVTLLQFFLIIDWAHAPYRYAISPGKKRPVTVILLENGQLQ